MFQVGALVGGITARQRKEELERLNEQLRKINLSLRQQARAGTVYAPGGGFEPGGVHSLCTTGCSPGCPAVWATVLVLQACNGRGFSWSLWLSKVAGPLFVGHASNLSNCFGVPYFLKRSVYLMLVGRWLAAWLCVPLLSMPSEGA